MSLLLPLCRPELRRALQENLLMLCVPLPTLSGAWPCLRPRKSFVILKATHTTQTFHDHGALPVSPWQLKEHAQARRIIGRADEYCSISNDHQIVSAIAEALVIKMQGVLTGSSVVRPDGKFKALAWRSPVPPYYSYTFTCEMQKPRRVAVKKKRVQDISR